MGTLSLSREVVKCFDVEKLLSQFLCFEVKPFLCNL